MTHAADRFDWGAMYYRGLALGYDNGYAAYRADRAEQRWLRRRQGECPSGTTMKCLFCNRGPADGVSLFRLNAKGQPGVWACMADLPKADTKVDPQTHAIVAHIESGLPVPQEGKHGSDG